VRAPVTALVLMKNRESAVGVAQDEVSLIH
jgi:hypothetical protein